MSLLDLLSLQPPDLHQTQNLPTSTPSATRYLTPEQLPNPENVIENICTLLR